MTRPIAFILLLSLASCCLAAAPRVSSVVVNFADGTSETLTATTQPIPPTPPVQPPATVKIVPPSSDVIGAIKPGDVVEFQAGNYVNKKTLNLPSNATVRGVATTQPSVAVLSTNAAYGTDFASISAAASNVTVDNLTVESRGNKTAQTIVVSGRDCTITNIRQVGVGKVLRFDGAVNLHADLLYANTGSIGEYAIGCFGGSSGVSQSVNCHLDRFDVWCANGVHGIRIEHSVGMVLGHDTACLPELTGLPGPNGKGFAFRAKYSNPSFGGTAIAVNDGSNPLILRGQIFGKVSIGPLNIWHDEHPDWRMHSPEIRDCEINGQLVFNLGTTNASVKNCLIRNPGGPCLILNGQKQTDPAKNYPPTDGVCEDVEFTDIPPVNLLWTFTNCTVQGHRVGKNGGVE